MSRVNKAFTSLSSPSFEESGEAIFSEKEERQSHKRNLLLNSFSLLYFWSQQ